MPRAAVIAYAKKTFLPKLDLDQTPIEKIIPLLQAAPAEPGAPKPEIVFSKDWTPQRLAEAKVLFLRLQDVPLEVALSYLSSSMSTGWDYQDGKIVITPKSTSWGVRKRCACGHWLTDENGKPYPEDHHSNSNPSDEDPFKTKK